MAFWLNFLGGRYIISSGGQSGFAAGFAFHQQSNKFVLTMATLRKKWEIEIDSIPKVGSAHCRVTTYSKPSESLVHRYNMTCQHDMTIMT